MLRADADRAAAALDDAELISCETFAADVGADLPLGFAKADNFLRYELTRSLFAGARAAARCSVHAATGEPASTCHHPARSAPSLPTLGRGATHVFTPVSPTSSSQITWWHYG